MIDLHLLHSGGHTLRGNRRTYNNERTPPDLAKRLETIRGKVFLWERYTPETQERDSRATTEFRPALLAMAVRRLFQTYVAKFPDRVKLRPHDLRRRAITLTVKATGSIDAAAAALGVRADTASRHYLDPAKAFDSSELMRKMAGILLPQNAPESPQNAPEPAK